MPSWLSRIQHVIDGEPVDAGATSRPTRQLEENLTHVKDLLELSLLGQALVARDVAIDPALVPGQAVWWNPDTARAEAALASTEFDDELEILVGAPQSEVLGVLYQKSSATSGAIALLGWITLDIASAVDGSVVAGRYYLSGQTAGGLVRARPSLSVPVLFSSGDGRVLILPQWRSWAEDHQHFRIPLTCAPAGDHTPPAEGARHEIENADDGLAGWLPADHAIFAGHAPSGAKFGYNLDAHPRLKSLWPPFPVDAAVLVWDKGEDQIGGTEVPARLVTLDQYGIWWMSDCYADVPWPPLFTFDDGDSTDAPSESEPLTCPREETMTLALYFSRALYDATRTMVTSLQAAPNSILQVYGCYGQPARTGDLIVDADLALAIANDNESGHLVLKDIVANRFRRGPVVEGVKNGGGLSISATHQTTLEDLSVVYQGITTIGLLPDPVERELFPAITRLGDTKERNENGVVYLGFPVNFASNVRQVFQVPTGIDESATVELRLTLLGTLVGTLPDLDVSFRRIPAGSSTPAALPSSDTALALDAMPTLTAASQYVRVASDTFTVQPGDIVLISVNRTAGDGYSGELGLLRSTLAILAPEV